MGESQQAPAGLTKSARLPSSRSLAVSLNPPSDVFYGCGLRDIFLACLAETRASAVIQTMPTNQRHAEYLRRALNNRVRIERSLRREGPSRMEVDTRRPRVA